MTETITAALETVARTIHENQRRQAETAHRLMNAIWVLNRAMETGDTDVAAVLSPEWPTMPTAQAQPLDEVLDEYLEPQQLTSDPELDERISRIAYQLQQANRGEL